LLAADLIAIKGCFALCSPVLVAATCWNCRCCSFCSVWPGLQLFAAVPPQLHHQTAAVAAVIAAVSRRQLELRFRVLVLGFFLVLLIVWKT
jgi:hypothetical protein